MSSTDALFDFCDLILILLLICLSLSLASSNHFPLQQVILKSDIDVYHSRAPVRVLRKRRSMQEALLLEPAPSMPTRDLEESSSSTSDVTSIDAQSQSLPMSGSHDELRSKVARKMEATFCTGVKINESASSSSSNRLCTTGSRIIGTYFSTERPSTDIKAIR